MEFPRLMKEEYYKKLANGEHSKCSHPGLGHPDLELCIDCSPDEVFL